MELLSKPRLGFERGSIYNCEKKYKKVKISLDRSENPCDIVIIKKWPSCHTVFIKLCR
jgi:hypothetical protein